MRILVVNPMFQHPVMKCSPRYYYLLRELGLRHRITLIAPQQSEVPREALEDVRTFLSEILLMPMSRPGNWIARAKGNSKLRAWIGAQIQRLASEEPFDLILFHGKEIFGAIQSYTGLPLVIDICDAAAVRHRDQIRFAPAWLRPALWWKYAQIRRTETRMVKKSPFLSFISERDRRLAGAAKGKIVPNGVDLSYWSPVGRKGQAKNAVVFTGVMRYPPNFDAARLLIRSIMPAVWQRHPETKLLIVGRAPTAALKALSRSDSRIEVTGAVDDVRPYLESALVFSCPIRFASGTQNKVLEAMAMGLPVVTTRVVAEGLRYEGASDPPVRIADTARHHIECLMELLSQPDSLRQEGQKARTYVETHSSWERAAGALESLCFEAISPPQADARVPTY